MESWKFGGICHSIVGMIGPQKYLWSHAMKVHISLPEEVLTTLRQLAHGQRGTMSEVVRQLVIQESTRKPWASLADMPPPSPTEARVRSWLRLATIYPDKATIEALVSYSVDPVTGLPLIRLEDPSSRYTSMVRRIQGHAPISPTDSDGPCPRCQGQQIGCPAPDWDTSNWRLCPRRVGGGALDPTPAAALLARDCFEETGSWPPGWRGGNPPKSDYKPTR